MLSNILGGGWGGRQSRMGQRSFVDVSGDVKNSPRTEGDVYTLLYD